MTCRRADAGERRSLLRHAWRVVVAVVGGTVVLIGVAMIVLPGPAMLVIPLGLGILALEFAWAERLLKRVRKEGDRVFRRRGDSR
jgi:tellurite resistance protein TerC